MPKDEIKLKADYSKRLAREDAEKRKANDIAAEYGVTVWTVHAIWRRRPWVVKRLENTRLQIPKELS
jgi:hypothetical protein